MNTLISLQGQSENGSGSTTTTVDHSGEKFFDVTDPSVAPALPDLSGGDLKAAMSMTLMPQLG